MDFFALRFKFLLALPACLSQADQKAKEQEEAFAPQLIKDVRIQGAFVNCILKRVPAVGYEQERLRGELIERTMIEKFKEIREERRKKRASQKR